MSGAAPTTPRAARSAARARRIPTGPGAWLLVAAAVATVTLLLVLPLAIVFRSAFEKGISEYFRALADADTLSAVRLTLFTAAVAVSLNLCFGVAAAWLLAKYEFWGKSALITLIDLPFSVSPVISGLVFVLLFGAHGWLGPWLIDHDLPIIFHRAGIAIATTFVTFPMVAREVLTVMQAQGSDEEEAALTLGASGWQILWNVTLPKVRWGLLYGMILCNARAMGEFGAVSVVSGHVRGETNTVPLQVEILYNEYHFSAAFAVASLLTILALVTLVARQVIEKMHQPARAASAAAPTAPAPGAPTGRVFSEPRADEYV